MNTNPYHLEIPETAKVDILRGAVALMEGRHLTYLASLVPNEGTIVEIGSLEGKSACYMGIGLRYKGNMFARIHCIDLWTLRGPSQQPQHGKEKHWQRFLKQRKQMDLERVLIPHMADSTEFVKTWSSPINLLFIDGGHTYEQCHADYLAWHKFIVPGGYIVFHDYTFKKWPGVAQVVDTEVIPSDLWDNYFAELNIWSAQRCSVYQKIPTC